MKNFVLDGRYGELLNYYGIKTEEALRKAGLAGDIFSRKTPVMSEEEYLRFMDVVGAMITDPAVPIQIACTDQIETFSPPIFAAYCSKNGLVCMQRLARYKRLIGPMLMKVSENDETISAEFYVESGSELPSFLAETEIVFLVNIIRKATKESINPIAVSMTKPVNDKALSDYLQVNVEKSDKAQITFAKADMEIPFISYNDAMWSYFEPELTKRLSELDVDDSTSARVRAALTELLPGGACGIDDVCEKLHISKRSLQRKLSEENTTFQKQLNSTRETLAIHYIRNTDMTTNDIAYLLGYQELNSFLRAFTVWTGKPISEYRKEL